MFNWDIPWQEIWNDIIDVLLWWPRRVFELLTVGLAELIIAIPVPDWVANIPAQFSGLIAGIEWAFWLFNVKAGLGIVISAYGLRFIIRRLPIVG
ncbi:MAG: hypothetical protein CMD39_01785 [Gammaproteobacteria bacterium]|nr:hypothetical protein [Gammaproteobacteria bacterium]|tara:strand:- start:7773 stop:8057 length:285 start_codon:yes stop_codon:yes gene_type:complete